MLKAENSHNSIEGAEGTDAIAERAFDISAERTSAKGAKTLERREGHGRPNGLSLVN
jgi:hypothetical protein